MRPRNPRRVPRHPPDGVTATYNGTRFVGRLVYLGDDWRAEGSDGRSLGVFGTRAEAAEALREHGRAAS